MSGQVGRSGRRRKPLEHHLAQGSYRPSRHGPLPATVAVMPVTPPAWAPTEADLAGLGEPGTRFLRAMLADSDCTLVQGVLLLQVAQTLDALTTWRQTASSDPVAARLALAHSHTFAHLLAQLRAW